MLLKDMPEDVRSRIIPKPQSLDSMVYRCIECDEEYPIQDLLYTCPKDGKLLDVVNLSFEKLKRTDPEKWKRIFDFRKILNDPSIKNNQALHGIFRFYEFVLPVLSLDDIIYLGEADTPLTKANDFMEKYVGVLFYVKNDGLEPSVSFKDRGMASAVSFLNALYNKRKVSGFLGICASTGDTSASAAIYLSYLNHKEGIKSAVLLPQGKVTPAQLSQPLGAGAKVIELPGVFDDCMKVVEELAENYDVALLNSKNGLRVLGQKTYTYEIAEKFGYDMENKAIVVPVGNAGNITAILNGFIDFYEIGLIGELPKIVGVQSENADPIVSWVETGVYEPFDVKKPSTAQAAYIGKPVSFPRVYELTKKYRGYGGKLYAVRVSEQEIMDNMLTANQHGHTVCTQGGEAIAGLKKAVEKCFVENFETAIVDSTSHQIKFAGFQDVYFKDGLREYGVIPREDLINMPTLVDITISTEEKKRNKDIKKVAGEIAKVLDLKLK